MCLFTAPLEIKRLFINKGLLTEDDINNIFCSGAKKSDVWTLIKEALERKLTVEEFYRIIHHIAKRRGFKSVRKSEEAKAEGDLLKSLTNNIELFNSGNYQTIGEMFATIYTGDEPKRNKKDNYKNSVPRELLYDELKVIFTKQRQFGLGVANCDFEEEIFNIAFRQRPIQSMKEMVGYYTIKSFERNL